MFNRRGCTRTLVTLLVLSFTLFVTARFVSSRAAETEPLAAPAAPFPGLNGTPSGAPDFANPGSGQDEANGPDQAPPQQSQGDEAGAGGDGDGDFTPSGPTGRDKILGGLYDTLGRAKSSEDAGPITERIQRLWHISGSDTIDLLMSRAQGFVKQADLEMASDVLDYVVELAPDYAEGWHQRAMVSFLQHDYDQARADLKRTLALDPRHYQALGELGAVLQEMGDKKGALDAYRRALRIDPYLDQARQGVKDLSAEVEGQGI